MRILSLVLLTATLTGCAEFHHRPLLGTRVHTFNVAGRTFVHCSILMEPAKAQESHDAIAVCQDEVQAPTPMPLPEKQK